MTANFTNKMQSGEEFDLSMLSAYLDRELSLDERNEVEKQLQANPFLRETLRDLQRVQDLVRSFPVQASPVSPIQGEWNLPASSFTTDSPSIGVAADEIREVSSSSLMQWNFAHNRFIGFVALAASILAIVSGTFLLPSLFSTVNDQLATSDAPSATKASATKAMANNVQNELDENFEFVTPEELPTVKLFIQARRVSFDKQKISTSNEDVSTVDDQPISEFFGDTSVELKSNLSSSRPEIMEVVLQRSHIESFLTENHLNKIEESSDALIEPKEGEPRFHFRGSTDGRVAVRRYEAWNRSNENLSLKKASIPHENEQVAAKESRDEIQATSDSTLFDKNMPRSSPQKKFASDAKGPESNPQPRVPTKDNNGREKSVEQLPQDENAWVHLIIEIVR